jgi:hypothetical protein
VRLECDILLGELGFAKATVRQYPDISILALRKSFPELDRRMSDQHFQQLKDREGRVRSGRKFAAKVFADASGYLEEDTVYRYLKFKQSRQVKKLTRGRPSQNHPLTQHKSLRP